MKRFAFLVVVGLVLFVFPGCSGDDGTVGPQGPSGESAIPRPFALTFVGAFGADTEMDALARDMVLSGVLHPETEITSVNARTAAPDLADLQGADVVLVFAGVAFQDPDAVGDVLADYVDAGGAVVSAQYCFYGGDGYRIGGRFAQAPYSPVGETKTTSEFDVLDVNSIDPEYFDLFHGIGTAEISMPSSSGDFDPPLNPWGKVIVRDRLNHKIVSINDTGTVMALGVFPPGVWWEDGSGIQRLVGNCLAFMGGAL